MPDPHLHDAYSRDDSDAALESLIRAAGDYIHPTDDLRPRTLETARLRCRQQRRASGMAIAAVLLVLLLPSGMQRSAHFDRLDPFSGAAVTDSLRWQAGRWQTGRSGASANGSSIDGPSVEGEVNWALVEIFTQLRRQQAELLHGVRTAR